MKTKENFLFRFENGRKFVLALAPLYTIVFIGQVIALWVLAHSPIRREPIVTLWIQFVHLLFLYVILMLAFGWEYAKDPAVSVGTLGKHLRQFISPAREKWWIFFAVWLILQGVAMLWGSSDEMFSLSIIGVFFKGSLFLLVGPFALRSYLRTREVVWAPIEWFCGIMESIGQSLRSMSDAKMFAVAVSVVVIVGMINIAGMQFPRNNVSGPYALLLATVAFVVFLGLVLFQQRETDAVRSELQAAREMQMGLMPKEDPVVKGFDISGVCIPANEVGGDFFDYVWLDEKRTRLGIAVADVSGKAMKAAITAVMTSGMIYREVGNNGSPKLIMRKINKPMYAKLDSRMFTALSFAMIDTKKKEMKFSNAGQAYPVLKRGKEVIPLEVKGARLPLGVKEDVPYGEMMVKLKKGDTVIFYTDGIPEAKNEKDEFYGFERFRELTAELDGLSAREMRDKIVHDVKSFSGKSLQYDDMTVVVVKVG